MKPVVIWLQNLYKIILGDITIRLDHSYMLPTYKPPSQEKKTKQNKTLKWYKMKEKKAASHQLEKTTH